MYFAALMTTGFELDKSQCKNVLWNSGLSRQRR